MPVMLETPSSSDLSEAAVARWRDVPVAVAVDVGRAAGQIDPAIRPLCPPGHQPRLFGRAVTALCEPPDFGAVPLAIDLVKPGDVLVIAAAGRADTAMIGEILGGHVRRRGGVGLVCDGAIRDVGTLARWADFSVFTRHVTPRGPSSAERGRINAPVVFGGQVIHPGDLVIGDDDGLVVLRPEAIVGLIADAEAKIKREAGWEQSLAAERSMAETFGLAAPQGAPPGKNSARGRQRRLAPRVT